MKPDFLKEHLNVWWLRPESALWDAIASDVVARVPIKGPSLDLGCGNGIFSFITAGGAFDEDYDWFVHADPAGFKRGKDIYDVRAKIGAGAHVRRRPRHGFDWAMDHKPNLLSQAARLGFYGDLKTGDAQKRLPFEDDRFQTIFSNILYWLRNPEGRLREIRRILRPGGRALLCLQDPRFKRLCQSYQWRAKGSALLRIINRGRAECSYWTASLAELKSLARETGFRLTHHETYLSPLTLKFWDIGLRSLSPPLLEMTRRLAPKDRRECKALWIKTASPVLHEMLSLDQKSREPGGYHFAVLEKN